jgi:hypothetical protein
MRQTPFPTDALPAPFRRFTTSASRSLGCDESYLALPLLCAAAGAIGNARAARLKRSWIEPAIVWGAIVGASGTVKSEAIEAPMKAIKRRQATAIAEYDAAFLRWQDDVLQAKKEKQAPPEPPICERWWFDDCTIEALAPILRENPRGLLLIVDELKSWIGGFDQYRAGKGGDVAKWLSIFRAKDLCIDRKTAERRLIYVPRAAVSIIGGIQPETLAAVLTRERFTDGFAARILLAMPDPPPRVWSEIEIGADVESELDDVLNKLLALEAETDDNGNLRPSLIPLDPAAKRAFVEFFDSWNAEKADLDADLQAAWSKLEGYTARLALVHQLVRLVSGDGDGNVIDERSMKAGIALARWFGAEARRVYGVFARSDDDREQEALLNWIDKHGGETTARELSRGPRQYRQADDAQAALSQLVKSGKAIWQIRQSETGPAIQVCRLQGVATGDRFAVFPEENGKRVAVASVAGQEIDPDAINAMLAEAAESEVA